MELTNEEKIILKNTDKRYIFICRDYDGNLYLFKRKPSKFSSVWIEDDANYLDFSMYNHLFQDIKWKNKEPYKFR